MLENFGKKMGLATTPTPDHKPLKNHQERSTTNGIKS